jgi:methionyl aminopeptidase
MIESYKKAGKIVSKVRSDASKLIKDDLLVIDLVEFVESEIVKAGGGIAFPCNVSINEITAHYTSPLNDETKIKAGDLVKLDLGAEIDGYIADSAITVMAKGKNVDEYLNEDEINKSQDLISASEAALDTAISTVKDGVEIGKIGKNVEDTIHDLGFKPINNLTGHSLDQWNLHSGISIPNINDKNPMKIHEGDVLAIEPFVTDGIGSVVDTPNVYIFKYLKNRPFRVKYTKKVLDEIKTNYTYLPFSGRWLTKKFNENRLHRSLIELSQSATIYPYNALKEKSGARVAQKEHTVIVEKDGCEITTK